MNNLIVINESQAICYIDQNVDFRVKGRSVFEYLHKIR